MRLLERRRTLSSVSIAQEYVAALDGALVGPARVRRGLVREARDHLEDAASALGEAGYEPHEAERRAVEEFGRLDEIVPAFQTTLAVAASRRTAWMLLAALSIQPLIWDGPLGRHDDTRRPDGWLFTLLDHTVEWGGSLMIAAALALLVATTIGNRWFAVGRSMARFTAVTTIACSAAVKVLGLSLILLASSTDPVGWLMFGVFILVPFAMSSAQARRTLALC